MVCLHCGKKIGVLRKLQDEEFCSAAHRKAYKKKQEDLAVDFLIQSRRRLRAQTPVPETPAGPQPIPALAEFVPEGVTARGTAPTPLRNAEPMQCRAQAGLPAVVCVTTPGVRSSAFARTDARPNAAAGRMESAARCAVEFGTEPPRLRTVVARPLWIEPARQAPSERRSAAFVAYRIAWVRAQRALTRSAGVARFPVETAVVPADVAASGPAFRLAGSSRPSLELAREPAGLHASERSAWVSPAEAMAMPVRGMVVGTSGFPLCDLQSARVSPAGLASGSSTPLTAPDPLIPNEPPLTLSLNLEPAAPSFRPAPQAVMEGLRPAAAAGRKMSRPRTLVWKFKIHLGPYTRVNVIRPQFESPMCELPVRSFQRKLPARPMKRLADLWSLAPRRARQIAVLAPLGVMALVVAIRVDLPGSARGARDAVISHISQRAAVDISDDFRSGLSQWTGAPGWANTWSYDGTGFARPGRLALLAGSLPLADYRLEFLGQIEKKAISWVFRASDAHNYYAMKLVETNRGPAAAFFIVRYAVIEGRERLRIQLPLPVLSAAKTMFRVRQEIRGAQFTTYLDGRVVDTWSDSSLARGGVGFLADPGESAYIRWVDVAYQDDPLGRLCSYLAPAKRN